MSHPSQPLTEDLEARLKRAETLVHIYRRLAAIETLDDVLAELVDMHLQGWEGHAGGSVESRQETQRRAQALGAEH